MKQQWTEYVARVALEKEMTIEETKRILALARCNQAQGKKTTTPYEIVATQQRNDFTLAMVHYNTKHSSLLPEAQLATDTEPKPLP